MKAFDSLFKLPCQLQKGLPIIVTTLLGIVMLVRDLQSAKARSPIVVTLLGIFMVVRESQNAKAPSPIIVTLLGMFMLVRYWQNNLRAGFLAQVRELHPQKALFPITFTPSLIEYLPFNSLGAQSNLFQSLLYFTPNSSSTAFLRSSSVTSVLHTSSVTSVLHTSSSFGFSTLNSRKEHIDKFFLALANRNIDSRVLVSSSANKSCRAVMVLLLLKSR